jgi:para-nitrobenzyl esterase
MAHHDIDRRRLLAAAGATAALAAPGFAHAASLTPVARTAYGRVSGYRNGDIQAFKGIPYGLDTAETRFAAPKPPRPWRGIKACTAFGPMAPQPGSGPNSGYLPDRAFTTDDTGEDMLKLNIWTPGLDGRKRPVLVWIHGGGFINFSANSDLYDGTHLAQFGDAVVVSMNHRLAAFGFLYLAELGGEAFADSGNAGMLDLVLMLQWVRDNIAEFGGDPECVTIWGQSGGGAKCSVLMGMPAARGLFHRVMTMSGQQVTVTPPEMATETARRVLTQAGVSSPDALKRMTKDQLIAATRGVYYGPVLDGRTLNRHPFEPDATPVSVDVPLIMGNTHDETRLLIGPSDPALFDLKWEDVPARVGRAISGYMGPMTPEGVTAWYRDKYPAYSPSEVFFAATTALRSWRAQIIQADRRAVQPGAGTWVYQFDWKSPAMGGKWGAPHCADIPFFFRNNREMATMTGGGAETDALAETMSTALLHFARTGDPNGQDVPDWPKYALPERVTMQWDTVSRATPDPRGEERRLVELIPYRQPGT